ncbi:hypothetical protein K1T71_004699 [Dendrolimus kikuchii]|uniref:Uncharacterized protein n=1 Tax=Dendrolimus kikuchii TaxID=765133 RepID=A0ACC1D868_9NEOP|nr:hypothetical protein K1T71_004699 [Dendrolimus kikuchii]
MLKLVPQQNTANRTAFFVGYQLLNHFQIIIAVLEKHLKLDKKYPTQVIGKPTGYLISDLEQQVSKYFATGLQLDE